MIIIRKTKEVTGVEPHGVDLICIWQPCTKQLNKKKDLIQNSYIMNNKRFISSNLSCHANVIAAVLPIHPTKPNDVVQLVCC